MSEDASSPDGPGRVDDLQEIHGIGKAIEQRLRRAGIRTYSDVAGRSADDLADLTGTTVQRVQMQDWPGKARRLAEGSAPKDNLVEDPVVHDRQHEETFAVRLLLDERSEVRRTHVIHARSGREEVWSGWDPERLTSLLTRFADLARPVEATPAAPTGEAATATAFQPEAAPPVRQPAASGASDGPVGTVTTLTVGTPWEGQDGQVRAGEPFRVTLRLELDPSVSGEAALGYVATVAAKHMGEGSRRLLGEARGHIDTAGETVVEVDCTTGPGTYLVEAAVALLDLESGTAKGLASLHEGVVLHAG